MRLTLLRDGDIGKPVAEQNIEDHPDEGALQDALDAINEAAQETLVKAPAAAAKAAEEAAKAAEAETSTAPKASK